MRKLTIIICALMLPTAIAGLVLWLLRGDNDLPESGKLSQNATPFVAASPSAPSTSATTVSPRPDSIEGLLKTPFQFYGIVLDQDNKPVVGAIVDAAVMNSFAEGGTPVSATSDAAGRFSIQSHGASLHVNVSRSGYYQVDRGGSLKPSSQGFDFGVDQGRGVHRTDPASPDVFHLRKAGNPVVLERFDTSSKVPRDGSPVLIRLSKTSNVTLRVRCRTIEDGKTPIDPYDWRCEVDVEGGGIQEVIDETSFTAPEEGYAPSAVIDMPKSLGGKKWSSRATRSYWLRFADNTFARIEFQMIARGDHFASIEGYRNPTANIRNLEPIVVDR